MSAGGCGTPRARVGVPGHRGPIPASIGALPRVESGYDARLRHLLPRGARPRPAVRRAFLHGRDEHGDLLQAGMPGPHARPAQHALLSARGRGRCRPETSPGSPEWNVRADLAGRAVRLIADGYVDEHGVDGLARRLAVTERHLRRLLVAELGAGPLALTRSMRMQTARRLLAETTMPVTEIAFASGFSSV